MLPFSPKKSVFQTEKCLFTYGAFDWLDPRQLANLETKAKKPWSSFQDLQYVFQMDLLLPQEHAKEVQRQLATLPQCQFSRAVMTLGQILEGDFFKEYIKAGSVLLLSEGHVGKDNVFALRNGQLTMFLDRESYERTGLTGQPHGAKSSRGLRSRWVVEFDLNTPSMWPGKKGFDRLIYACKHVFTNPLTWLFHSLLETPSPDPLAAFSPTPCTATPTITTHSSVNLPPLGRPLSLAASDDSPDSFLEAEEAVMELYEWISLVRLGSPRVQANDNIDPYLSRYQVPGTLESNTLTSDVCKISWRGFFPPSWACHTLIDTASTLPSQSWFAFAASGFAGSKNLATSAAECTLFRPDNAPQEFLLWAIHGRD